MSLNIDRRLLITTSLLGMAGLAVPGAASILIAQGFTHGVASGEPSASSVLLWTRYASPNASDTNLVCEMAEDASFAKIISGGEVIARGARDYTAKLTVTGLAAGRWYYYRFIAPGGVKSLVGRTRTLPEGDVARFGIGVFSCANLPFGWFNAYAHAAMRDDLDLIVHTGDYLYEYEVGAYPSLLDAHPERSLSPSHEMVALADYRLRYACYRSDADLQKLHQRFPMIAMFDDHETANNSWKDGAENHQPDSEGDWGVRKAAAMRAWHEWMPVSDRPWESYEIGTLASLFRLETRITARSKPLELHEALAGKGDLPRALADFRDGAWSDKSRALLGQAQEDWLYAGLNRSGARWQILAQQIVMGALKLPQEALDWMPSTAPERLRQFVTVGVTAAKMGLPFNFDAWDGYPAARSRLLAHALAADSNLIVLAGDSHNAWGNNLREGGVNAGVEFGGHSVSSPGFEFYMPHVAQEDMARALRTTNPDLAFTNTKQRGYVSLELTPEAATGTWHFLSGIRARSTNMTGSHSEIVRHGARHFEAV